MNEELTTLVVSFATCIPIGLLVGIIVRKTCPSQCKSYAKYCMSRKWWLFAFGIMIFLGLSIVSFSQGRYYFGIFFLMFVFLEAFALIKYGFKTLTPELEAKIDASDPTKLWPISFWKNSQTDKQAAAEGTDKPHR